MYQQRIINLQHTAVALYPLPPKEKHPDLAEMSQGEFDLLSVLVKATHSLLSAVRRQAKRTFHEWLTATREAAKGIGERAVRRAAAERAHEELLSQERKMLQGPALTQSALPCIACTLHTVLRGIAFGPPRRNMAAV